MSVRSVFLLIGVLLAHAVVLGVVFISSSEKGDKDNIEETVDKRTTKTSPSEIVQPKDIRELPAEDFIHVIKKGDSLSRLASRYKMSLNDLCEYNQISNPNKIRIGQKIRIPKEK